MQPALVSSNHRQGWNQLKTWVYVTYTRVDLQTYRPGTPGPVVAGYKTKTCPGQEDGQAYLKKSTQIAWTRRYWSLTYLRSENTEFPRKKNRTLEDQDPDVSQIEDR